MQNIFTFDKVAKAFGASFDVEVVFRGNNAYISLDKNTGKFVIVLPAHSDIINDLKDDSSYLTGLEGLLDHEIGELLYSNLGILSNLYAHYKKEYGNPILVDQAFSLWNMINDMRVNFCISNTYPGCKLNIDHLNEKCFNDLLDDLIKSNLEIEQDPSLLLDQKRAIKHTFQNIYLPLAEMMMSEFFPETTIEEKHLEHPAYKASKEKVKDMLDVDKYLKKLDACIDDTNRATGNKAILKIAIDMFSDIIKALKPPEENKEESEQENENDDQSSDKKSKKGKSKKKPPKGDDKEKEDNDEDDGDNDEDEENQEGKSKNKGDDEDDHEDNDEDEDGDESNEGEENKNATGDAPIEEMQKLLQQLAEELNKLNDEDFDNFEDIDVGALEEFTKDAGGGDPSESPDGYGLDPNTLGRFHPYTDYISVDHPPTKLPKLRLRTHTIPEGITKQLGSHFITFRKKLLTSKRSQLPKETEKGKINPPKLYRLAADNNVIFKKTSRRDKIDTAVSIIMDGSGSVLGNSNAIFLKASMLGFADMLELCKIPYEVRTFFTDYGYTDGIPDKIKTIFPDYQKRIIQDFGSIDNFRTEFKRELLHYNENGEETGKYINTGVNITCTLKRFDDAYNMLEKNKEYIGAGSFVNDDVQAVMVASKSLARRKEKKKLLIVLSDFIPNPPMSAGFIDDSRKWTRHEFCNYLKYLKTCGIMNLCIFIGSGYREEEKTNVLKQYEEDVNYYMIPSDYELDNLVKVFEEIINKL